jgi:hypothetical protein
MTLEIAPNFEAGWSNIDMGRLANWYHDGWVDQWNKFQNRNTWWLDDSHDIFYGVQGDTATVQFGCDRSDFASARGFHQKIWYNNETINSDNSIDADVTVYVSCIMGYKTTHSQAGYPAETSVRLGGQTIAQRTGNTIDNFYMDPEPHQITKHIHVPPQQKATGIDLVYFTHYPTGVYPDSPIKLGLTLFNPLPAVYKPMALRKRSWRSLDDNNGFITIRKGGNWEDKSEESNSTSLHENQGHNRIRRSGKWLQLPKM